jgi:hypothetical protein
MGVRVGRGRGVRTARFWAIYKDIESLRKLWAVRERLSEPSRLALRICLACAQLAQESMLVCSGL